MKKSAATRLSILQKAFELIYTKGYQATSVDEIIATTQVTKGAFYYHFKSKDEMGLAIIEEIMKPALIDGFITPFTKEKDPLNAIYKAMENLLFHTDFLKIEYGCPASNFAQEMSPWNEQFTAAINELTDIWTSTMANSLNQGIKSGLIRKGVQGKQVAFFVLSGYWGIRNFGKLENNSKLFSAYLKELKTYLNTLR